jgi:cyclopropane fatty-acyl-phospholipid synthase-like methyltransferase
MQERHRDRQKYFEEQSLTTLRHVVPYLTQTNSLKAGMRILEIGCGEGGNLAPLLELGCEVVGVDYVASRIALAEKQFEKHPLRNKLTLEVADIYDWNPERPIFDLIIMRDVIEHIHDQDRFMGIVKRFMHSESHFFLAFPPWQNPFGGHQQICSNRWLSKLPYYHLLPKFLYKSILKLAGESPKTVDDLLEIKETGISLERFERICSARRFEIVDRTWWFINPNYEIKFGLRPRKIWSFAGLFPYFRNFYITCGYYILKNTEKTTD